MKKHLIIGIIVVLACVVLAVLVAGNVHVIYGEGFKRPKVIRKDTFTFAETYINLDNISGKDWEVVEKEHPVSAENLLRRGLIWRGDKAPAQP